MNTLPRRLRAALHFVTQLEPSRDIPPVPTAQVAALIPLAGMIVGLCAATVYWLGIHLWPTSVAVVVSMLATGPFGKTVRTLPVLMLLLVKYNALMGLSASTGPLALTPDLTLGLIMIAGHATGGALVLPDSGSDSRLTAFTLCLASAYGFAPAVLLGVPGLVGLAAAIVVRMAFGSAFRASLARLVATRRVAAHPIFPAQQLYEVALYLGALATWKYV